MNNFLSGNGPTTWGIYNGDTRLDVFNKSSEGDYRLEFRGQNGSEMLRGTVLGSSTDQVTWSAAGYDTVKVFKMTGNELVAEYILQPYDGNIGKQIMVEKTYASQSSTELAANTHNYLQNVLPTLKMRKQ